MKSRANCYSWIQQLQPEWKVVSGVVQKQIGIKPKKKKNMLCLFFQSLAFSSMKPNREQADQGEMQSVKSQPHKAKYRMVSFVPRGQSLITITSKPM